MTGLAVDWTGRFGWAFGIAAAFSLLGVLGWILIVAKVAPLDWSRPVPLGA